MKRFAFRLQRVYEYKQTLETQQKAALAAAVSALNALQEDLVRLESELFSEYRGAMHVRALADHAFYLQRLREERTELLPKIAEAERVVEQCRDELLATMKELKAFEKLRTEQYAEWRVENEKSDRAALEDYIAGN